MTARDEGAGTMEVTRAAEDAACAAYRALDMGQRWTLEPAMRAALKAALPHLAAPVSAPGMDREAVARIVDGSAFRQWKALYDYCQRSGDDEPTARKYADDTHGPSIAKALAKADQIIALQRGSEPADGSQVEPSTTGAGRHNPLEPPPFIQWNGGENPAPGKVVQWRNRCGETGETLADVLHGWAHPHEEGPPHDIIAYRIIPTDTGKVSG